MKLIYSKFAIQNILCGRCLWKVERPGTSHNKLEETGTCQKQFQTSGTKKSLILRGRPTISYWFWIASMFILIKIKRTVLQLKEQFFMIIYILSGKLNVKMTPSRMFRVFRAARYYRLYRQIFFNRKDYFFVDPNICLHDARISFVSSQGIPLTIITF